MASDKKPDLPSHKRFKYLHLGENYDIIDLNIDHDRGDCTFETEDGEIEVSGSTQDFLDILSDLVRIKKHGEIKYVDITDYPVGDKQSFCENLRLFETPDADPVKKARRRINNGSVELPEGFSLIEGTECIIDKNFNNKHAQYIVDNPYVAVSVADMQVHRSSKMTEEYREKANNAFRYRRYVEDISKILYSRYMSGSPDADINRWRSYRGSDLFHSGNQVSANINHNRERARRMAKEDISTDEPVIELLSLESESIIGKLEPDMGMREIADEYASISESIKPLLRDLLVSIDPDIDRSEVSSFHNIKEELSKSDYSFLQWAIEPQLRHGHSHSNIQIDEENQVVNIYDRDDSDPSIVKQLSYDQVTNKFNQFEDLTSAILHLFIRTEYKVIRRFLDSEEFRYHCSLYYNAPQ